MSEELRRAIRSLFEARGIETGHLQIIDTRGGTSAGGFWHELRLEIKLPEREPADAD